MIMSKLSYFFSLCYVRYISNTVGLNTQFVGSKFGIFGEFRWVRILLFLLDEPGFRMVRTSVFPDFWPGLANFWLKRFEVRAFWRGS